MKKISVLSVLLLFLTACTQPATDGIENETSNLEETNIEEAILDVYTTAYPLGFFTERIGGERVNVSSVYPPGTNEHVFEPTQQDMISLAEADLLFYVGLGLEGFMDSTKETLSGENVQMVAVADAISDEELVEEVDEEDHVEDVSEEESLEEDAHSIDPHVWISPVLSQKLAAAIKDSLIQADAEGAEIYEANFNELVAELKQLDQSFSDLSSTVENKTFFVSHAAFGYLAETYGFEQVAVAGLNSQDEPSQKELVEIVNLAKEKSIDYIVFEQNVSSKLTEVIQKEIGAEAVNMHNLSVLTQEDIDNNETYFTLMRKNFAVLETILN
ncbi:metal ABC transporter solute-binding protein, Zn/Mn family [Planomicrobium sp. MB-3u-38]|uniref:metal ABC transporter solute-binding protein, Zn/Mn family n=1 Tax=Planomicrobium sp. MB-3u-38 TaxID=2058318 RepID=UPI000C7D5827|nr:zinc ABC transporter substrate-binding protein [Planomicrobium sp. MB-3u-38]PKH10352.1 adhesin [Planomicrobium sp. MB-3u-38]